MNRAAAILCTVLALPAALSISCVRGDAERKAGSPAAGSLADENLLLAASEPEIRLMLTENGGRARLDNALAELLVEPPEGDLLEDWRWLVGDQAEVFKVTVFGDMLLADPAGKLYWLEIGRGTYQQLPAFRDSWLPDFYFLAPELIHAPVLHELRAQDYALSPGEVYDWIKSPMIGGTYSKNNVQRGPIKAVITFAGRLAKRRDAGSPPAGEAAPPSSALFQVIVNDEGQYSMMPAENELPPGWRDGGKKGTSQECIDYIEKVWTDMRPKSLQPQSSPSTSTSGGQG